MWLLMPCDSAVSKVLNCSIYWAFAYLLNISLSFIYLGINLH